MDYAAQANSIYDPQRQADESVLSSGVKSRQQDITEEEQLIDPAYDKAVKSLFQVRKDEGARQDHLYSQALEGNFSGLQANQQRLLGEKLTTEVGETERERAQKKGNIASRRRLIGEEYANSLSALISKYSGLKSEFIVSNTNRDRQVAQEQAFQREMQARQADSAQRLAAANRAATNTPKASDYHGDLQQLDTALQRYQAAGYRGDLPDRNLIINQLAAGYGSVMSPEQINKQVNSLYGKYHLRNS